MTGYDLSRCWFNWCFENPEKVSPNHTAIYFFAIEHCNRLGWKNKFGFPTQMAMDAIGIKKHQTYIKYFNDLVEWGFFDLVQKSQNQYSSNIISLQSAKPKNGKALDKAFINHAAKQTETIGQSTGQSNSSIYKQDNNITINKEQVINTEKRFAKLPMFEKIKNEQFLAMCEKVSHNKGKLTNLADFKNEYYRLIANKKELHQQSGRDEAWLADNAKRFIKEQAAVNKEYDNYADFFSHFLNWTRKQPK